MGGLLEGEAGQGQVLADEPVQPLVGLAGELLHQSLAPRQDDGHELAALVFQLGEGVHLLQVLVGQEVGVIQDEQNKGALLGGGLNGLGEGSEVDEVPVFEVDSQGLGDHEGDGHGLRGRPGQDQGVYGRRQLCSQGLDEHGLAHAVVAAHHGNPLAVPDESAQVRQEGYMWLGRIEKAPVRGVKER